MAEEETRLSIDHRTNLKPCIGKLHASHGLPCGHVTQEVLVLSAETLHPTNFDSHWNLNILDTIHHAAPIGHRCLVADPVPIECRRHGRRARSGRLLSRHDMLKVTMKTDSVE